MKTIKTSWNSGNFTLTHSVEATDEMVQVFAEKGLLWFAQRNREHDVVLGAFESVDGKNKRRKGFSRGDVGFTSAMANSLSKAYTKLGEKDATFDVTTTVGEYIRDVADSKFTEETAIASRHESAGDLEEWLEAKCDYVGETHGEDGEFAVEMLRAVRTFKIARLAALREDL